MTISPSKMMKLYRLSQKGVGGEAENAKTKLLFHLKANNLHVFAQDEANSAIQTGPQLTPALKARVNKIKSSIKKE